MFGKGNQFTLKKPTTEMYNPFIIHQIFTEGLLCVRSGLRPGDAVMNRTDADRVLASEILQKRGTHFLHVFFYLAIQFIY